MQKNITQLPQHKRNKSNYINYNKVKTKHTINDMVLSIAKKIDIVYSPRAEQMIFTFSYIQDKQTLK